MDNLRNDPRIQHLRDKFQRKTGTNYQRAILGDGNGTILYPSAPGYVYVRVDLGSNFSQPTKARMDATMDTYDGAACAVATVDGELAVVRGVFDVQQTQTATRQVSGNLTSGGASNFRAASSYNLLDAENNRRLFRGKLENALEITATAPYSQSVNIAGETWLDNGTFNVYSGEALDLSGDYPASGKRNLVVIFLLPNGTIETQATTDKEPLDPPLVSDIQSAIDSASEGAMPLAAVNLVNGDNEIKPLSSISTQSCLWDDLRSIHSKNIKLDNTASGFFDTWTVVSGNAITLQVTNSQVFDGYWYQAATISNGDSASDEFRLAEGSYTLYVLGRTANNNGIIDWSIDGTDVITGQDWYSAGTTFNVVKSGSITVTRSGRHTLQLTTNGKNASSSDYAWTLTRWWIK